SNRSLDRSATPLKVFWPCTAMLYPRASNGSRGKASLVHLISCRQTMSGCCSLSQVCRLSMRWRMELTFQVAIRMIFGYPGRANNAVFTVYYLQAQVYARVTVYMLGTPPSRAPNCREKPRIRERPGRRT